MTKPAIPFRPTADVNRNEFEANVKTTLDQITGQARNVERLSPLEPTATLEQIVAQLNAVVSRLQ
jgi:DNA-binding FrmR family transcriptional regulator